MGKNDVMTIETTATGTIVISEIVGGYLQTQRYIDYTMEEAVERFKEWLKTKREKYEQEQ